MGHTKNKTWYQNRANALVKELSRGDLKWETLVWQNLGWHYGARSTCKRFEVLPSLREDEVLCYHAYLHPASDMPGGRWSAEGQTPLLAVKAVRQAARKELVKYVPCIDVALVPALDDNTIEALLGWLYSKEHQHTNGEGKTSFRVILPEELFDTLVEHLEAMRGWEVKGEP